ncbi:unknown [Clostridium sp. CAG:609]|nr:unknown [Clostridium sp. CAG:609]
MKKHIKLLVVLGIILVGSFSFYLFKCYKKDALVYENNKIMPSSSGIAMMLETSAGSGNYEITTRSEWPTEGYVFNVNLSKCENGSELSWDNENKKVLMSGNKSDKCYVYFDVYVKQRFDQSCNDNTLACHTAKLYTGTQGANNIYYHDANLTNGAGDNSYRYAGASGEVNNYVCFGSNVTPCPADNLYRIIGVFGDKVKLIKSDYATSTLLGADGDYSKMYTANGWDNSAYKGNNLANIAGYTWNYKNNTTINSGWGSNTWSTSLLNKTNLNKNFITNIGAEWANKIDMTTWKVGGNTWLNIGAQPAKTAYQNEIVNPVTKYSTDNKTEYSAKIGLMYVTDYGFAAAPSAWTAKLENYEDAAIKNVNWMYMGLYEWTISRNADRAYYVFGVLSTGIVSYDRADNAYGVRPVFYLSSSVNYASGSGSAADPILVN